MKAVLKRHNEQRLKSYYDRLNKEASEDFGKYLSDDDDDDDDGGNRDLDDSFNRHKAQDVPRTSTFSNNANANNSGGDGGASAFGGLANANNPMTSSSMISNNNSKHELRKTKSNGFFNHSKKSKKHAENNLATTTDMCGLFQLEPSPKEKERMEKYQQNKKGLGGLKNKIKQFFASDGNTVPHHQHEPAHPKTTQNKRTSALPQYYYPDRSIQSVDYRNSKIGYMGASKDQYYSQIDELRNFDMEARMKNYKYNPNNKVAIMDDSLQLHYSKMNIEAHKPKKSTTDNYNSNNDSSNNSSNSNTPAASSNSSSQSTNNKSKLFNNKLTSILSKAKVFNKN